MASQKASIYFQSEFHYPIPFLLFCVSHLFLARFYYIYNFKEPYVVPGYYLANEEKYIEIKTSLNNNTDDL